jgi:hypothetical protein
VLNHIAEQIKRVQQSGVELGIVVGAGNIFRGSTASAAGMDRATGDYAGMLATIINARFAGCPRTPRHRRTHAIGDHGDCGSRAVYPTQGDAAHWKKDVWVVFRSRDRQSIYDDRHGGRSSGASRWGLMSC